MSKYVPGNGNPHTKLVFVGDFPTYSELEAQQSLIAGPSGDILRTIFNNLGYYNYESEFYFTNVFKYQPPFNSIEKLSEVCNLDKEIDNFWKEINQINPNVVVTFGPEAFHVVTGVGVNKLLTYRGTVCQNKKFGYLPKVIPTIHPLNITFASGGDFVKDKKLYEGVWKLVFQNDIEKAINESKSISFNPPNRLLRVVSSSPEVINFINRHKGLDPYIDVETYKSTLSSCISIAYNPHEAISIPLFQRIGNIQLCTIPHSDLSRIWQTLQELFNKQAIRGQNLKFDQGKLELLGFSFPRGISSDIMLKAHTVNPEMPSFSLSFFSSIYTNEPYYKDEGKEFDPKKHDIKRLFLYNAKDSAITAEIDIALDEELKELSELYKTDLVKFYREHVNPQHSLYFDIEKIGFNIDYNQRQFLRIKYETWLEILQDRLNFSAGKNININSPKQIGEFIYNDLKIPIIDKYKKVDTSEDTLSKLLKDRVKDPHKRQILKDILEFRRVSKTLSTYLYCKEDYDGRIRSQYRIIGTETGRSSTSIFSEPVRPEDIGFAFQTLTKSGDIGSDIRSYLIPRPGYVFISADLSQAEARVVALLSKDYDLLRAFDKIDIHKRTAGLVLLTGKLNLSEEFDSTCDSLGKDSPERFIGKKTRHAANYSMGWREFMTNVISDCRRFNIEFTISKFLAEKILDRFHEASPNVREVFHREIKDAIDYNRTIITPHGRLRRFFGHRTEKLYKEAYAYIPQSTVKARLTEAAFEIRKKFPQVLVCGEAHDSLLMQVPINEYKDIYKEIKVIMEKPIDFSNCTLSRGDLIIPCEGEVGENYLELEKIKIQ